MRKFTANKIFRDGMEALSKTVEKSVLELSKDKEAIKQLSGYDWILVQWKIISKWMVVRNGI